MDDRSSTGGEKSSLPRNRGLHRVLIGRSHVERVSISERADVITDDLVRNGGCGLNDMSRARESHDLN